MHKSEAFYEEIYYTTLEKYCNIHTFYFVNGNKKNAPQICETFSIFLEIKTCFKNLSLRLWLQLYIPEHDSSLQELYEHSSETF